MPSDFWKPLSKLSYPDVEELKDSGAREKTFLDYKQFDADCLPMAREKLAPILASFANGGGGRLVFGAIEKNERIVGFEGAPKVKSRAITASIRNAAHSVQPPAEGGVAGAQLTDRRLSGVRTPARAEKPRLFFLRSMSGNCRR